MCQDIKITPNTLVAVHEASHAVIAWCVGYSPLPVKLRDERTLEGRAEMAPRQSRATKEAEAIVPDIGVALDVVVALAGIEAEIRLCPETCMRKYSSMLAHGLIPRDYIAIRKSLHGYQQIDVGTMMPVLVFICRRLVEAHWHLIQQLAAALLTNGIVKRKEMRQILAPNSAGAGCDPDGRVAACRGQNLYA